MLVSSVFVPQTEICLKDKAFRYESLKCDPPMTLGWLWNKWTSRSPWLIFKVV